jgi:hypothetical protein
MIQFSFSCKAGELDKAEEMAKTIEKGVDLFDNGDADIDWFCDFVGMMEQAAEEIGVSFTWGNSKKGAMIL